MKIINFTYTKANGNTSERVILPTVYPSKIYEGIDMSELTDEEIGQFVGEYNKAYDTFLAAVENLKADFDLRQSYRRFIPENMSDIEVDAI